MALAPIPVTNYIVDGYQDDNGKYAAAAHFELPFGMNSDALFHPKADNVVLPPENVLAFAKPDSYSYSTLNFNRPSFTLKNGSLLGSIQNKSIIRRISKHIPQQAARSFRFTVRLYNCLTLSMSL